MHPMSVELTFDQALSEARRQQDARIDTAYPILIDATERGLAGLA